MKNVHILLQKSPGTRFPGSRLFACLHIVWIYNCVTDMTDYLLKYMSFLTTSEMAYVHQTRKKVIFVREQDLDLEMFWQFI